MTTEAAPQEPKPAAALAPRSGIKRWTAFGAGVGIEIRDKDLQVTIVRVRPSEIGVLGAATVTDFRSRPPAQTGIELYGESEGRPVYSAVLPVAWDRAVAIARAELRLDGETPVAHLTELLPRPALFPADYDPKSPHFEENVLPYATAIAGA